MAGKRRIQTVHKSFPIGKVEKPHSEKSELIGGPTPLIPRMLCCANSIGFAVAFSAVAVNYFTGAAVFRAFDQRSQTLPDALEEAPLAGQVSQRSLIDGLPTSRSA